MTHDAIPDYLRLREKLKALQAAPVPDMAEIDRVIDELEAVQLQIKGEHGLHGNNPNE
jgi:hypothetical protein